MSNRAFTRLAVVAVLAVTTWPSLAQGFNDHCLNAQSLAVPYTYFGTNIGATFESGNGACVAIGADVWFRFVAPFSGTAVASTCPLLTSGSADFDTVITIRNDYLCGFNTSVICCSDDHFNCALSSHCTAQVVIGTSYLVQVAGWSGAQGHFVLDLDVVPYVPPNDECSGAIPVVVNSPVGTETFGAGFYPNPVSSCGYYYHDVWYSFVAPSSGLFTASTCTSNLTMNSVASVWQGPCGALTQVACANDGCGGSSLGSLVSWCATAGTTYYISVGSVENSGGSFSLIINPATNPPMDLQFFHAGPSSVGFALKNGPPGGTEFTAVTTTAGAYPNGWFWGISPGVTEVVGQWLAGFPFSAPLAPICGTVTIGPFFNLPPGLTLYAVSIGFASGSPDQPVSFSNPAATTIP